MKTHILSKFLTQLEQTSGRNQMTEDLAEFLPKLKGDEIEQVLYIMMGRLTPRYEDVEFNVSRKLALRALQELYPEQDIATEFKTLGDVGLVAEKLTGEATSDLEISETYKLLYSITQISGTGSQEGKLEVLKDLTTQLDPLSARYIYRVVIGSLRLGLSDKTVLDSLSWAIMGDKSLRKDIERAYGARADIGETARLVLEAGTEEKVLQELSQITVTPGVPVSAKLVEREKDAAKTFKRMGPSIVQPKLDGLRAQIHFDKKSNVRGVFSRNMESLTDQFPDLLEAVETLGVDSIILDSEAIGYDHENQSYLPFQETMQRRRKHGIEEMAESIPVKAMAFDVLYLNGVDWTQKPVQERIEKLEEIVNKGDKKVIDMLDSPLLETEESLEEYFVDKISQGLEGVIVKKLDTTYDPGTRNFDWIKLKANTRSDMVDTVDVVVLGYFHGRGERAKYGFGSLLTGIYNPEDDKFYSVAKVGTGFTDKIAPKVFADLQSQEVSAQPSNVVVEKLLHPDVWLTPEIVMEVDADEITRSPSHTAARTLKAEFEKDLLGKGLSLRFPRLKIWARDKQANQATTDKELLRLYELRRGPK